MEKERKSGKEASRWCLFPRSPSVCSLGQRWLRGNSCKLKQSCSLTMPYSVIIFSLADKALMLVLI